MKTKRQAILARLLPAVLLSAAAGGAHAAIATGSTFGGSSGELFLSVWDQTSAYSYSLDLGVTVEDFLTGQSTPRTWVLDQRFEDFAAAGNPLKFNIAANNTYQGVSSADYGIVTSVQNIPTQIEKINTFQGKAATGRLGQMSSAVQQRVNRLNQSSSAQNGGASTFDFTLNLSEVTDGTVDAHNAYFTNIWGNNLGGKQAAANTTATVGSPTEPDETLALFFLHLQGPNVNKIQVDQLGGGTFTFALDVANKQLVWSGSVAPVPIPAGVWLLSSALAALGFLRRPEQASSV
ncbi:uncharacterized protein sS8_3085 [Methylocaldum marinum]|uniref:Uncharacterized protein n=1 Tax=Methylocaldum marinum TaxID=1432792 RepID=A0A250KTP5_9GAMM|nr:hypothetical protein [Methylocaldum marinum]BBA35028.1 uncharacterized protein sS8_3085 [Methylocaldum marinum]